MAEKVDEMFAASFAVKVSESVRMSPFEQSEVFMTTTLLCAAVVIIKS